VYVLVGAILGMLAIAGFTIGVLAFVRHEATRKELIQLQEQGFTFTDYHRKLQQQQGFVGPRGVPGPCDHVAKDK